jgi:polyisoprenyl-phosphate glycosyltransferase
MLSSITAILIVREHPVDAEMIKRLLTALSALFVDTETVIVVNGASADKSLTLKNVPEWLPDCTILFLSQEVHDDVARLLGIDHAISDYVLFATPVQAELDALPAMIAALREGNDLVIGERKGGFIVTRSWILAGLFRLFHRVYWLIAGRPYEAHPPVFRIFSRAAALYIATQGDGEVLVRARALGSGFPVAIVSVDASPPVPGRGMPTTMAVAKALRLILTGSALPLRFASYLGFFGGIMSVVYAIYVLVIYLFKTNVEPGWTTLSLQSAGMMFLFSVQFLFLSEYLVQILSSSPPANRRHLVARELRGTLSGRSSRLNLVDGEGRFHIGAPQRLISPDTK